MKNKNNEKGVPIAQEENGKDETEGDRLYELYLSLQGHMERFSEYAIRAESMEYDTYITWAKMYIEKIEDDLLRYREGRPQDFVGLGEVMETKE